MSENLKFIIYFLIGGSILTLVTYSGDHNKGILAAFIAMFPFVTAMSILRFTVKQEVYPFKLC